MIKIAIWRRPDEGFGAWVFLADGKEFWVSGSSENVVMIAVETELNRKLPAFISYGVDYVHIGRREWPTLEEAAAALNEALAA